MKCITQLISLCFLALIWMGAFLPVAVNSAGMTGHFRLSGGNQADFNTCQTALPVEVGSCGVQLDITDGINTFNGTVETCSGNAITGEADVWATVTIPAGNLPEDFITIQYDNSGVGPVSDIAIAVYTDCNDLAGSLMGCVDDLTVAGGMNVEGIESILIPVSGGETFYIRIINKTPQSASGKLSVFFAREIIYVNAAATGANNGSSWADAFTDLQDALTADGRCATVTEIWVAAGTYYPDEGIGQTDNARASSFNLCNGINMYGGFQGIASDDDLSDADPAKYKTILSGDLMKNDGANFASSGDNAWQVVRMANLSGDLIFDGFIVEGGNGNGAPDFTTGNGAGIYISAQPNNFRPTIRRSVIRRNQSSGSGGGVYVSGNVAATFIGTVFTANKASVGGGVSLLLNADLNIGFTNCVFYANEASFLGNGLFVPRRNVAALANTTMVANTSNSNSNRAAGINNEEGTVIIRNSILWSNTPTQIRNEVAGQFDYETATLSIANSILEGGVAGIGNANLPPPDFDPTGPPYTQTNDLGGNKDLDPLFVNAADADGADDCWRTADDGLQLLPCSPAIDMGEDDFITLTEDIVGNNRKNDADPGNDAVDMGAYEFQGVQPASCTDCNGIFNGPALTGTSCDDADATTENDMWDNDCNCVGTPIGPAFEVSGTITWEHNPAIPVPNATVTLSDMGSGNTDLAGEYGVGTAGGNLTLTPTKTTGDPYEGVDVADVTRIQQHVTFIDRLDDGYKVIAADVNQSNSVTGFDAAVIFHALNNNPNATTIFEDPAWRFVEATHSFIDENAPWTPAFPEDISLTNVMANVLNQDFVGVKMGDVNGTWGAPPAPLTAPLSWTVPNLTLKAGQTLRIPFRATGLPDVAAWQFALRFDTDYLRFERALPTAAFPLKDENFGAWQADRGELRSVFAVPQGLVLPKDEVLFELEFQVFYDGLQLSEVLRLAEDVLRGRVYNTALDGGAVALAFKAVETRRIASLLPGEAALGFALEQNVPNPFSNETLVRFELPEAGEAVFSVHDVQGRLLYEQRGFLDAGLHEVRLDAARLGVTGALSYTLRSGAHSATRRMVLVR